MVSPTLSCRSCLLVAFFCSLGCAPVFGQSYGQSQVAQALKEALQVAADRSTAQLGQEDGFFGNALVKILLPEDAQKAADFLRRRGGSVGASLVDDVIEKMNRAAEMAVAEPEVKAILVRTVKNLTLADAFAILKGDSSAATAYLRSQTEPALTAQFRPIIAKDMEKVGLQEAWAKFAKAYNNYTRFSLFGSKPAQLPDDLSGYVTQRTLAGLFVVVGQKEAEIRRDPLGKADGLVKDVFGSLLGER